MQRFKKPVQVGDRVALTANAVKRCFLTSRQHEKSQFWLDRANATQEKIWLLGDRA